MLKRTNGIKEKTENKLIVFSKKHFGFYYSKHRLMDIEYIQNNNNLLYKY